MQRNKQTNDLLMFLWKQIQIFFQKITLSATLFFKNELLSHSAAAAFFFLLSVTPIFLLMLLTFDRYLTFFPNVSENFFTFLETLNPNLDKNLLVRIGLLNVNITAISVFGLLNLFWAGCWILTAIQKGLEVIFKSPKIRTALAMNVLSLLTLTVLLGVAFLITVISIGLNFFQALMADNIIFQAFIKSFIPLIRILVPFMSILLVIFVAYRFVPGTKPSTLSSFKGALGCALAVVLLHLLFARFFSVTRFNVTYGVLGSLILMLLWVHFTFVLFFLFAEYTYVSDNIDVLALERMYFFRSTREIKGKKVEKFLFSHPKRVFEKYARRYEPGEVLFREGDNVTDIFFVYRGIIGIYRNR
ncbi:YhjD/YihY/BrkB family envelope integrity protein, partial [Thermodesulfobacteriota bacterium]